MEEIQRRLQLYQPLKEAYCEHVLQKLSDCKEIKLMAKIYQPYSIDNYELADLNDNQTLLKYLNDNCNGQVLRYEEIDSIRGPELVLSCPLGTIDVEFSEGLERDWYNFAISFLKNEASQEMIDDLAYEYAIQYEPDGFTDYAQSKFMTMWPDFLSNVGDKDEYWNIQDILIELENDHQLSGIRDAIKLIKQKIAFIWNSQYVRRSEKLLAEQNAYYDKVFQEQLNHLPLAVKKIEQQLEGKGQLNATLFDFSILNSLTKNLSEHKIDRNDKLLQALKEKYNLNEIYDLKHDFLQYLLETYNNYIKFAAVIPPEPHKYRVYLCNSHNKNRRSPLYQSAIEYYFYHQEEIDHCKNCEVESQLHYYSSYCVSIEIYQQSYTFYISYPVGKTWLPDLNKLPKVNHNKIFGKEATEDELLWAYDKNLLDNIAEFMNK